MLGLLVYLFSFGDVFTIESSDFPQMGSASGTSQGVVMAVVAALVSGLIAAASLLPRQKAPIGVIAAVAVLSFLLVLAEIIQKPEGVSIGWALYVVVLLTLLQSAVAIGALLLDSGIIKAPVPKPKYDEQQPNYGPYGQPNQYYGQHGAPQGQGQGQQRPPYPGASTAAATPAQAPRRAVSPRSASRAARRPLRPASRPTASRSRRSRGRAASRRSSSRSRRRTSPATRRRSPNLTRVNAARVSKELLYR